MRADAQRNLDRVVAAARDVLLEQGLDAPVDDIARRAGVGVGTVYRRFADRDALVREIVLRSVADMLAGVAAADAEDDPWAAFSGFVRAAFDLRLGLLATALFSVMSGPLREDAGFLAQRDDLLAAVDRLLLRAQSAGVVRDDVGVGDLLTAVVKASRPLPGVTADVDRAGLDRAAALLLDGMRAGDHPTLPGRRLTAADLDRALSIRQPGEGNPS
jgi:AcrR family transcriptional regulator